MKIFTISLLVICLTFLSGFKNSGKSRNAFDKYQPCFKEDEEEFVELMNGKIIKGNVSKFNLLKTNNFQKRFEGNVVIDGVTYQYADVMAVQYKKEYFRKTPYNEFAVRISRGKINRYASSQVSGSSAPFVQKGDNGILVLMSNDNLRLMVNDYPPAIAVLDTYDSQSEKQRRRRKFIPTYESIEVYNAH